MARYRIERSERFDGFLHGRINAQMEDYRLSSDFWGATVDYSDKDAHNFYDIILNDEGKPAITYTTEKRLNNVGASDIYARETFRIAGKPGKVAQRVTGITDGRALDVFVNALATYLAPPDESLFDVAVGTDITYWYSDRHYCACDGRLQGPWSSCMRHPSYGRDGRFRIYEESAKLLIRTCETCGKLKGRAVLWEDDDGDKFIDRIYANTTIAEQMREWALRRGYTSIYGRSGHDIKKFSIDVSRTGINLIPYLDSLGSCARCLRVYVSRPPECGYMGTCMPHSKTFTIPEGKMKPSPDDDVPDTCESCGRETDEDGVCQYVTQCENCDEDYCGWNGHCPNNCHECECGAWYDDGDVCPNTVSCPIHETMYCTCSESCEDESHCDECGWQGCDEGDATHHEFCQECEEWYCAYRGRSCPNTTDCEECADTIPCEDRNENERFSRRDGYTILFLCEDCAYDYDEITALMENMILPVAQAEMALYA
jgi:hypothetical protein